MRGALPPTAYTALRHHIQYQRKYYFRLIWLRVVVGIAVFYNF
jgi:hypothetical protein